MSKRELSYTKTFFWTMFTVLILSPSVWAGTIKGSIAEPTMDASYFYIKGWACETRVNKSINAHLYVRASGSSTKTMVAGTLANRNNEKAVNDACGTSSTKHRFQFKVPKQSMLAHQGKQIEVYGISVSPNVQNLAINRSGAYRVASFKDQSVIGYTDSVIESGAAIQFSGWACQRDVKQSLKVHVYVGGAAGQGGVFVGSGTANIDHEKGVSDRCGNTGKPHRYKVKINESSLIAHRGKPVYVHGISALEGYRNDVLNNGGKHKVPMFKQNMNLSQIAKSGNDTIIPEGVVATLDSDHTTRILKVMGTLVCPTSGNRTIRAKAILVSGHLKCGSESTPVKGKIKFRLRGELILEMDMVHDGMKMTHDMGIKAFAVASGGLVEMYGERGKSTWANLSRTAHAGESRIKINKDVNWQVGDRVAIAPTDYDFKEAEEAVIKTRISSREFDLDRKLSHTHYGKNKNYSNGKVSISLKSRAEVANLTRSILIETEEDVAARSVPDELRWIGAHMMVMRGGTAKIDSVEFNRMGQMGKMARYPFHWHLAGDVSGQFIKNSSIHHSFQRCITIHGTNSALVENNVCYDHRGHGIFLEDGSEINNVIKYNLVMKTRRPELDRVLLDSDHVKRNLKPNQSPNQRENTAKQGRRFIGPSAYWISNPRNTVGANVSAGSEGTGFWMSFEDRELCNPSTCSTPAKENTKAFNNNVSRSNLIGMTWDGARSDKAVGNPLNPDDMTIESVHYRPKNTPTFTGNQAMKSSQTAIYTRADTINFEKTITADSVWHHFQAFNNRIRNSILVGWGPYQTAKGRDIIADNKGDHGHVGVILYDGPFELDNVHFADFSTKDETVSSSDRRDITIVPFKTIFGANKYTNQTENLSFSPEPKYRADFFSSGQGDDLQVSNALFDIDGSLTGMVDSVVVPKLNFNKINGCQGDEATHTWICPASNYQFGTLRINNMNTAENATPQYPQYPRPHFFFNTIRNDGAQVHASKPSGSLHAKVNLLLDPKYSYTVDFKGQKGHLKQFTWYSEYGNQPSPIFKVVGVTDSCDVNGAKKVSSVNAVKNSSSSAYHRSGKNLFIKLFPTTAIDKFKGSIQYKSGSYKMSCR